MKLIHITGRKGSGKNVLLDVASTRNYAIEEIDWGYKYLLKVKHQKALDLPPQNEWKNDVVKLVLEEYWNKKYDKNSVVFFTGLYKPSEIIYLKSLIDVKLCIVSVEVKNDYLRYERIRKRRRGGEEDLTIKSLIRKDLNREGVTSGYENNDIRAIIKMADYRIFNEGSLTDFIANGNRLIDKIELDFIKRA